MPVEIIPEAAELDRLPVGLLPGQALLRELLVELRVERLVELVEPLVDPFVELRVERDQAVEVLVHRSVLEL
jgi:hypothetical protein